MMYLTADVLRIEGEKGRERREMNWKARKVMLYGKGYWARVYSYRD